MTEPYIVAGGVAALLSFFALGRRLNAGSLTMSRWAAAYLLGVLVWDAVVAGLVLAPLPDLPDVPWWDGPLGWGTVGASAPVLLRTKFFTATVLGVKLRPGNVYVRLRDHLIERLDDELSCRRDDEAEELARLWVTDLRRPVSKLIDQTADRVAGRTTMARDTRIEAVAYLRAVKDEVSGKQQQAERVIELMHKYRLWGCVRDLRRTRRRLRKERRKQLRDDARKARRRGR